MSLVETNWLLENLDNVKILDCSWHLPSSKREAYKEYLEEQLTMAPNLFAAQLMEDWEFEM